MQYSAMANKHSFVTRLQANDGRKQFARKVDDGESAEILHSVSRRYTLRRSPTDYDWTPGERVVLVAFTGAGMVPTSIYGTFQGFTKGAMEGRLQWSNGSKMMLSSLVQWQFKRIRPIACLFQMTMLDPLGDGKSSLRLLDSMGNSLSVVMMLASLLLEKAQNGQNATVSFFATLQSIITLLLLGAWYSSGQ
jgi:uncharacterized membrane protein